MCIPTFETPRLILRGFTEEDVDSLHQILSGADVLRYFPITEAPTRERVEKLVGRLRKHWADHGYGLWAVTSRVTRALMGRGGLQLIPETGEVEVDVILGVRYWGQGFATEAIEASLRFGAERLSVERIVGIVHPGNIASRRVLEKVGLSFTEGAVYFGMSCRRYAIEGTTLRGRYGVTGSGS